MTLHEARTILGLAPDEDPRPHLAELRKAREYIAEMQSKAPNPQLAERYRGNLAEFDAALDEIGNYLRELGLSAESQVVVSTNSDESIDSQEVDFGDYAEPPPLPWERKRHRGRVVALLLLSAIVVAGAGLWYLHFSQEREYQRHQQIVSLEKKGEELLVQRMWDDARTVFDEIEQLEPGSQVAAAGQRAIASQLEAEQEQFLGYWLGQARAEMGASRWDEAYAAVAKVIERFPNHVEAQSVRNEISEAHKAGQRLLLIEEAHDQLAKRQWEEALELAQQLLRDDEADEEAQALVTEAAKVRDQVAADRAQATTLYQQALARDQGQFDAQALEWLREAALLDPENQDVATMLERMSSYHRTIRVPDDFASLLEAASALRDGDRLVIAAGTWSGPLEVNVAAEIQGAGSAETRIEWDAKAGSVLSAGPGAKGVRIAGITFAQLSFDAEDERFSVGQVRGGDVELVDCHFIDGSGHGLLVMGGGVAKSSRCDFVNNGWNGVAVTGSTSRMELRECDSSENFGHGVEAWDHAALVVIGSRCIRNSRNGIHADPSETILEITKNQLLGNREFGLVLTSGGEGAVRQNIVQRNLLGGMVIHSSASSVAVIDNAIEANGGPGLVLGVGLPPILYQENHVTKNAVQDVMVNTPLEQGEHIPRALPVEVDEPIDAAPPGIFIDSP